MERFSRMGILVDEAGLTRLQQARVLLFGVGGVGSYAAEALIRGGVGTLHMVDGDVVSRSNINRQLVALESTLNRNKAEVMAERALDINPDINVLALPFFYTPDIADRIDFARYDYIVDAVDMVTAKLLIAQWADAARVPAISCMGAGNRVNATFLVDDIYATTVCPLARVMRRELKKRGIKSLKVVYSKDEPAPRLTSDGRTPGSVSYVPAMAGLTCAGEVIRHFLSDHGC